MDWRLKFIITWIVLVIILLVCAVVIYLFEYRGKGWSYFKRNWVTAGEMTLYIGIVAIFCYALIWLVKF